MFVSQYRKPFTLYLLVIMSAFRSVFSSSIFSLRNVGSKVNVCTANFCYRNRINRYGLRRGLHRMSVTTAESPLSEIESNGQTFKPDFLKERDSKYFDFQRMESSIYKWWEQSRYFEPVPYESGEEEPFVLPMPPPNVTGYLHMGHAIFIALQDIMARFHRMRGRPTLWLPGTLVCLNH